MEEKNLEDYAKSNYTIQQTNNNCFIKNFSRKTQMEKILGKGKRVQCKKGKYNTNKNSALYPTKITRAKLNLLIYPCVT